MNSNPTSQNKVAYDFFLSSYNEVNNICSNFKQHYIHTFSYIRIWNDGKYINLSNHNKEFSRRYFFDISRIDHQSISHFQNMPIDGKELTVWNPYLNDPVCSLMREYNYKNGISILSKHKDYIELFGLCPSISNNTATLINNVINNKSLYIALTNKFVANATPMINSWTEDKKAIFTNHISLEQNRCLSEKDIKHNKYVILKICNNNVRFTHKEALCMAYLSKGFTAKQIGCYLGISNRTVEHHLSNIKLKSGYRYNAELLEFFHISPESKLILDSIY